MIRTAHARPQAAMQTRGRGWAGSGARTPSTVDILRRAAAEPSTPLAAEVREPVERSLGTYLGDVRVRGGDASERAADRLGARAYTLGTSIHLGADARRLDGLQRRRLLMHEAVHSVQQGSRPFWPSADLAMSSPGDGSERQARAVAERLGAGARPAAIPHAGRSARPYGAGPASAPISVAGPLLQPDLKGTYPTRGGEFKLDLKTVTKPTGERKPDKDSKSGLSGTIRFRADEKAPDTKSLRLLQVVRTEDLTTGKDVVWSGAEADRNKVMTSASPGGQPGFFVDHSAAAANPRTSRGDPAVSPYYRDYWPNARSSQDGSKAGKKVRDASLWDYPGSYRNVRFSFETVAKATDTGHVYGTVAWGFTIKDASKGLIVEERAVGRNVTLKTTDEAVRKFDEFYRNPGSSRAPR